MVRLKKYAYLTVFLVFIIPSLLPSATFISVATVDEANYLKLLDYAAKERLFTNRWAKGTKGLFLEHKHFWYYLDNVKMLFLLSEPNRKIVGAN